MIDELLIKIGDEVSVTFNNNDEDLLTNCEIIAVPRGPGDYYQVLHKGPVNWNVYVLNNFESINKTFPKLHPPLEVVNHVQEYQEGKKDICPACWQTPCTC